MSKTLWQHYLDMTRRFHGNALKGFDSLDAWQSSRATLYDHFMRSVSLDRMPPKSDLKPQVLGAYSGKGFLAEKITYQILPDCYATGTVFYPDPLPTRKAPAVLYCCGHSPIGVYSYARHGILWARRGYVCLVFDTIQQQDNPGTHTALGVKKRYHWISMGHPGCASEIFNSIRALDLLLSLPAVDPSRVGATGTSGGGSLSFLTMVADSRLAAAASCCGVVTPYHTLSNRQFQMHCDCMFVQNVFQHDTSEFAALVAPRPLLFCYGTQDPMFSHDEYTGMVERAQRIYRLYGHADACQLCEYEGYHGYSQESITRINRWFDEHLAGEQRPLLQLDTSPLKESETTHFQGTPPEPNHLALVPEMLSPRGSLTLPASPSDWPAIRQAAVKRLHQEVFHYQANDPATLDVQTVGVWSDGTFLRYRADFDGMGLWFEARLNVPKDDIVFLGMANTGQNNMSMLHKMADFGAGHNMIILEPRGAGVSSTRGTAMGIDRDNFLQQAGELAGMTPLMLMIQDLRNVLEFLRRQPILEGKRFYLYGAEEAGVACIYHAAMDETIAGVVAECPPASHREGAHITGVLRVLDLEQAIGLLAPRPIALVDQEATNRNVWVNRLYNRLGCPQRLVVKCQATAQAAETIVRL